MRIHDLIQQVCREVAEVAARVDETAAKHLLDEIAIARRIFVDAQGRSGLIARCLAMRLGHLGLTVHMVGDATTPKAEGGDLLLVCTGSGETPTVIGHLQIARKAGIKTAVITACPDSPAAQAADVMIHLPAPTPKGTPSMTQASIQPMGSLFEQSLLMLADAMIVLLADRLGQSFEQMWQRHANLE